MEGGISWRHILALLITLTSAWLIWNGTHLVLTEADHSPRTPVMHVSLAKPPAPPVPVPPKVVPKPPKPIVQKQIASRTPVETSPHAIGAPVTNAPVASQNANPSPPAQPAPAAPAENISLELAYEASVHAAIEQEKRYPMSKDARLEQPSGTVVLWVTLDRAGELEDVSIEQSAGGILDRAAIETVRRTTYPPFPSGIWPNDSKARLKVPIHFSPQ
ncbi:MAG TPA: energy transducer TonB [Rhizomicrobium sp.]|nr:energy transducer TonB [Rhizomicrobium sp.]